MTSLITVVLIVDYQLRGLIVSKWLNNEIEAGPKNKLLIFVYLSASFSSSVYMDKDQIHSVWGGGLYSK